MPLSIEVGTRPTKVTPPSVASDVKEKEKGVGILTLCRRLERTGGLAANHTACKVTMKEEMCICFNLITSSAMLTHVGGICG
ncbi:hypothetical protein PAHAL_5G532200 [Panicum hallii]|uniref:Uncharacterized protein n=1 Tax=Panicum hallii TaxID=206008 RepID=A0A2T8IPE7_9POAL|nr:hypothetical protein PAHAL_5G532200 [Panicum hallii]